MTQTIPYRSGCLREVLLVVILLIVVGLVLDVAVDGNGSNEIIRNKMSEMIPSKKLVMVNKPTQALGYEIDSSEGWVKRLDHRNRQKELSNTVGKPHHDLNTFFQEHYEPTFSCTFPVRIGKRGDGGKWVCNPEGIKNAAIEHGRRVLVYSLGSFNDYSFETGINEIYKDSAEMHTFDMGAPKIQPPPFTNFHQWKMVGEHEDGVGIGKSLNSIMKELGHTGRQIDILKVDIEGSEYDVLRTFMTPEGGCNLPANILLMETHFLETTKYDELFKKLLNICNYELYMKEPNIQFAKPYGIAIEWCFVKVDWSAI